MSGLTDEDYWGASQLQAFSFDEGDSTIAGSTRKKTDVYSLRKENTIVTEAIKNQAKSLIPISVIITDKNLKKYLNSDKEIPPKLSEDQTHTEQATVKNVILDKKYNFNLYRSLRSKIELLDAAILSLDGDCIILVVLYLFKTLKLPLIIDILKTRPVAVEHYMAYLMTRLNTNSITELAELKEQTFIGLKLYSILTKYYLHKENLESLRKKLQSTCHHWFDQPNNGNDNQVIKYYIDLIDWQLQSKTNTDINSHVDNSVNECLKIYCQKYWDVAADHPYSPYKLASKQCVSNKQVEWIFLISKTNSQSWDDISKQFIKTNWFGNKKVVNSLLNIENIINYIGTNGGPKHLMENLLNIMDDKTKSVSLAVKFKCHRHIINTYVQDKDREALLNYKKKLSPQSEDYFYVENALRSTITKWKN